jgi:hypothetical protein
VLEKLTCNWMGGGGVLGQKTLLLEVFNRIGFSQEVGSTGRSATCLRDVLLQDHLCSQLSLLTTTRISCARNYNQTKLAKASKLYKNG